MVRFKLPKKRWKRVLLYAASTFCIALALDMALTAYWRRVTVSPETTYITSPIVSGGKPDFVGWFNQMQARGVTPDNNGAIPLLKAIGSGGAFRDSPNFERKALAALGLPQKTVPRLVIHYAEWAPSHPLPGTATAPSTQSASADAYAEERQMIASPWDSSEHPNRARWLDTQAEVLVLGHDAASRDRYYMPTFPEEDSPSAGQMTRMRIPYVSEYRYVIRMLLADAQRHAGDKDKSRFLRDITDTMHFAAVASQDGVVINHLVGLLLMWEACDALLPTMGDLSEGEARKLLRDMDALPPLAPISLAGQRCQYIDGFLFSAEAGFGYNIAGPGHQSKAAPLLSLIVPVNYNRILRDINAIFDQADAAFKLPTYGKRQEALADIHRQLSSGMIGLVTRFSRDPMESDSNDGWMARASAGEESSRMKYQLVRIALALAVYHGQKGNYPATLAALSGPGGILEKIPVDGFNESQLAYRIVGRGYLLYSVGKDLKDDGGDAEKDLVVRMEF